MRGSFRTTPSCCRTFDTSRRDSQRREPDLRRRRHLTPPVRVLLLHVHLRYLYQDCDPVHPLSRCGDVHPTEWYPDSRSLPARVAAEQPCSFVQTFFQEHPEGCAVLDIMRMNFPPSSCTRRTHSATPSPFLSTWRYSRSAPLALPSFA